MDRIRHIFILLLLGVLASQAEEYKKKNRMVSIFNIVKVSSLLKYLMCILVDLFFYFQFKNDPCEADDDKVKLF